MGKATKWFRSLLGLKKHPDAPPPSHTAATLPPHPDAKPPKRRWSFVKSYREKGHHNPNKFGVNEDDGTVDPNKHAIAVAAAAAAVAEAAVASAQAAASVLRMTSSGRCTASGSSGNANSNNAGHGSGGGLGNREEWAAVKIQSSFRAYLSRRALKALKALVKLQALVRGNIVRKQASRRIQALLRAQARACAGRSQFSKPPFSTTNSSSLFLHPSPATPEKFDHIAIRAESTRHHDQLLMLKRNGSKSNSRTIMDQDKALEGSWEQRGYSTRTGSTDDEKSDKILEIDTGKSHFTPKHRNLFQSPHHASFTTSAFHQTLSSPSLEAQPFNPLDFTLQIEADNGCTRGPFTPTKSDGSRCGLNGYSDHPNYLTCTESSKAKMRSLSAPKQRVGSQFERTSSTANRYSVYGELRGSSSNRQRVYGLNDGFASKAYPGSGRLDRLGMPVGGGDAAVGFGGGNWNRY